jgi:hypothetical protein
MPGARDIAQLQACIVDCLECYSVCKQEAMNRGLQASASQLHPDHFRLMHDCAEICRTAADFMLSGSTFHPELCAVCALVCEACARSCQDAGGLEHCARACLGCAQSCRRLAHG